MPSGEIIKIVDGTQQHTRMPHFNTYINPTYDPTKLFNEIKEYKKESKKEFKEDLCNRKYLTIVRI